MAAAAFHRHILWALMALTLLVPRPLSAAPPNLTTLYPLATQGDPLELQTLNTLLKLSIMGTNTLVLAIEDAPPSLDVPCVRSIFCLRALGEAASTPKVIVGLMEPVGERIKIYLVLYDTLDRRTLRAVEGLIHPKELGVRLPLLAKDLLRDLPPLPPGTPTLYIPPAPLALSGPSAPQQAGHSALSNAALREVEALDAELLAELNAPPRLRGPELFGSAHLGAARMAGYSLLASSLSLEMRFRDRLAVTVQGGQLTGRDRDLDQTFFLLSGGVAGDWYWGGGLIRPLTGAEVKAYTLAPTLNALGAGLRSGFVVALTPQVDVGALGSVGIARNPYLPETVFELNSTLPVIHLEISARMRFR